MLARNTFHWVLAFADGGLSTPAVFAEIDRLREAAGADRSLPPRLEDPEPVLAALASGDPAALAPLLGNDLQPATLSLDPGLRRTLRAGTDAGALAGHRVRFGSDVRVPVRLRRLGRRCRRRAGRGGRMPDGAGGQRPGAGRAGGPGADAASVTQASIVA